MEGRGIPEAHVRGIDLDYRAPDLPPALRARLPAPTVAEQPELEDLYWRSWAIAFDKVRTPNRESGLIRFVDEGFSDNIFQWDTCFMLSFLRYAVDHLPVYGTLDNFYLKQHDDGFICREISEITGDDFWPRDHPSAVNPPLFADAEWQLYQITSDKDRVARVLPSLVKYYRWLERNRRHKDGVGYWTTALASGMDNTPRVFEQGGTDVHSDYGYVWLCMTAQQSLAARRIAELARAIGDRITADKFETDASQLANYCASRMWNPSIGLYADVCPDGTLASVKTPATCWPLLSGLQPEDHDRQVRAILQDPNVFWRPHVMPSVSADHAVYHSRGNYWQGSVWPPLVNLAVRAMDETGHFDLAQAILVNHLENLITVFRETGTLWENYMPEKASPGNISRPEFAGWTGGGPIAGLIEVIIGIVTEAPDGRVRWRLTRSDRHGVANLPFGDGRYSITLDTPTNVTVKTNRPFSLEIEDRREEATTVRRLKITPGQHQIAL